MRIQIRYSVPVSAFVDTESGTIEDVWVWRGAIEESEHLHAIVDADTQLPANLEQRVQAHEIVDSRPWPEWRFV